MPDSHNVIPISTPKDHESEVGYLCSPYTANDLRTEYLRALEAQRAAVFLMQQGLVVYSPIAHGHAISEQANLPRDWEFWRRQCLPLLLRSNILYFLRLEGWETSVGMQYELDIARKVGMPVYHMDPLPGGGYRIGGGVK